MPKAKVKYPNFIISPVMGCIFHSIDNNYPLKSIGQKDLIKDKIY